MSEARIYRPCKSAMQSGRANTGEWVFEYAPNRKRHDRLMGWVGSDDTSGQVRLRFPDKAAAVAYAAECGLPFTVHEPADRTPAPKSYAANFAPRRVV